MDEISREKINEKAVDISALIIQQSGMCRYGNPQKCRRVWTPTPNECTACIKKWLICWAKKELKKGENR